MHHQSRLTFETSPDAIERTLAQTAFGKHSGRTDDQGDQKRQRAHDFELHSGHARTFALVMASVDEPVADPANGIDVVARRAEFLSQAFHMCVYSAQSNHDVAAPTFIEQLLSRLHPSTTSH